jgi:tRNA(Ile)-lysidine synthase
MAARVPSTQSPKIEDLAKEAAPSSADAGDRSSRDRREQITLIRPLILARRIDVEAHLARHHITAAHDPSNTNARFLRVRVRSELLPLMEQMSPAIVEHLCALADILATAPPVEPSLRGLGRAQRLAVARAKKCEREVKLRLSGGREVVVGFSGDEVVLIGEPGARAVPPK